MTRHGTKLVVTSKYPIIVDNQAIYLRCPKCKLKKPLMGSFGVRKMADKTLRNQPDCSDCRRQERKVARRIAARIPRLAAVQQAGMH